MMDDNYLICNTPTANPKKTLDKIKKKAKRCEINSPKDKQANCLNSLCKKKRETPYQQAFGEKPGKALSIIKIMKGQTKRQPQQDNWKDGNR
jgi:hypothetical protein